MTGDEWGVIAIVAAAVISTAGPVYSQLRKLRHENQGQHDDVAVKLDDLIKRNDAQHEHIIGKIDEHIHDHLTGGLD